MGKRTEVRIWKTCPACKGTGIRPNSLMLEPLRFRICRKCWGTGLVEEVKVKEGKDEEANIYTRVP